MFVIQSEIAQKVAQQLPPKSRRLKGWPSERPPTANIIAFDLYSRAKNLILAWSYALERTDNLLKVADLLNQAVAHDPTFFQARIASSCGFMMSFTAIVSTGACALGAGGGAIESALRLRPAGEAHLTRAGHLYHPDTSTMTALWLNSKLPARPCPMTHGYSSSRVMLSVAARRW
jgi:hypothetical protein